MEWLSCPECSVRCPQEDFLLEHISRRHCKERDIPTTARVNDSAVKKTDPTPSSLVAADSIGPYPTKGQGNHFESCEGSFFVFSPTQWRSILQLVIIGHLCGRHGMMSIMRMLLIRNIADTNRLTLLLSNDVEQNPGPGYKCGWVNCQQSFETPGSIKLHVVEHIHREKECHWNGCTGCQLTEFDDLWKHVVHHVYNNKEYTPSLEDWFKFLPGGIYLEDKTNLFWCPRHLRSKLQLMLFDEDFCLPNDAYTAVNHKAYVDRLSITDPSLLKQMISDFIKKRQLLGEDWSIINFEAQNEFAFPSFNINTADQSTCNSKVQKALNFKEYFGPVVESVKAKRKWSNFESSPKPLRPWSNNLIKNLYICDDAIQMQNSIFQTLVEKSLVTPSNQSFLKLEHEAAKLSTFYHCSNGTFFCFIFKCFFNDQEIIYVRYVEYGVYKGLMLQKYCQVLKEKYNLSDKNIFLHNTLTVEDIDEMKAENDKYQHKGSRPDKIYKHATQKSIPQALLRLKDFGECSEIKLDTFLIHALPFKSKVTVDSPERMYLEVENSPVTCVKTLLSMFRLNKTEPKVSLSKDILSELTSLPNNLFEQSIVLNCLSGDIKRKSNLFSTAARFDSNFFNNTYRATSLRNQTLQLYLQNRTSELLTFFERYFPELNEANDLTKEVTRDKSVPKRFKRSASKVVKRLVVTKHDVEKCAESSESSPVNLYESYCLSLLEHGTFKIQYLDESSLVCIMNDYSETDGSFKNNDFIYTVKQTQEIGDYFYCSCKTYRTLINVKDCSSFDEGLVVLDNTGENCVTCMHCMFLKERVLNAIEPGKLNQTQSRLNLFIQSALNYSGKSIIELSRSNETCKYSVLIKDEDRPVFIHLSLNKNQGNYVVSCNNGKCLSMKGHKRNVSTLASSIVCKHLLVFKEHREYRQDFVKVSDGEQLNETFHFDGVEDSNLDLGNDSIKDLNFDESSGLWNFKCKSSHSPNSPKSSVYKSNVKKRDNWNDNIIERLSDGCLNGPILVSEIPEESCSCGSGWVMNTDRDGSSEIEGLTKHEKGRVLTIYTNIAPVKCEVHTRLCINSLSPCTMLWDEGEKDSIHVLSRDTAAGDEIGWEFVSMVMKSGCTFSAYCQLKNDMYQSRDSRAKFMDSKVFINWWFSWAANLKIEFRRPCDICGYQPKRLCCEGTRVGVGFRHATFEEINKTDPNSQPEKTLHRRMDRCFLKNMNGIDKQHMIQNRETLNFLANREIGDLSHKDIDNTDLVHRINSVKNVLPPEVLPSFERFFSMASNEKEAYAYVLKMISTTASITSLLPPKHCARLQHLVNDPKNYALHFNSILNEMRSYAPELKELIVRSSVNSNGVIPNDIVLFIQYLIDESLGVQSNEAAAAVPQPGTYNPAKFGRAYYFNEGGLKLRNIRKFTIDEDTHAKKNVDHDDNALEFEKCQKLYSKVQNSAHGTSNLFLWFCADHGHCYGFHMTGAEGRKDPAASLYSHLEKPPQDIFYDFACNLQEYCLNRESDFYKDVRFFHDIFHSYAHKCSCAFKSSRLQGFESVNSEICEQFNSFIQCIKSSARQMSQTHFCFYLQFFLHQWNDKKRTSQKKIRIALAGMRRP